MTLLPKKFAAVFLAAAIAGCGSQSPPTVSVDGFAGVRFGMTVAQAEAALGHKLKPTGDVQEGDCSFVEPVGAYDGLAFMVIAGVIARLDVQQTTAIATDTGAKVGDSESRVIGLYKGRTRVEEHQYTGPEGHYVLVLGSDGKAQLVFETDAGKVVSYRAGRQPEVEWVEGCS